MDSIDVRGLPEDQVRLLLEFAEFLKARACRKRKPIEKTELARWPLGVKGKLTREEIYEDR
jgi:hypothetical protein